MSYPLLTQRLSIEPLTERDLATFVTYRQDPDVARFQGWDPTYSEHQAMDLVTSQIDVLLPSSGNWLQLAIHDRESGEHLGDLALHSLEEDKQIFEIGFTLAKVNQGKGIAKEAAGRLIQYLFDEVGASTVIANCDRRNISAVNLLLSLGFENKPSKSWTENFKNELVTMDQFELKSSL